MKILVTGAKGFVGKNLVTELKNRGYSDIYECDMDTTNEELKKYTQNCQFVFHLAGVNRPKDKDEFMKGNFGFTSLLLEMLKVNNNRSPIIITSSIQAALDNDYGKSKKAGEDLIFEYGKKNNIKVFVYRMPNVFGKWCRPNYNSVIATFCNNIARNIEITINDTNTKLSLVYIDDVVNELITTLNCQNDTDDKFRKIAPVYEVALGDVAETLYKFRNSREDLSLPNVNDLFEKKLYSTYLSYLPENEYNYKAKMNIDQRGSFTELFKTMNNGQVSVNISKPGIIKGNHWHHTKNEKFVVVQGEAIIKFRKIDSEEVIEYRVSGRKIEIIDIPVGYTHNIENMGDTDLVTIMWANEVFNKDKPDTYFLEV